MRRAVLGGGVQAVQEHPLVACATHIVEAERVGPSRGVVGAWAVDARCVSHLAACDVGAVVVAVEVVVTHVAPGARGARPSLQNACPSAADNGAGGVDQADGRPVGGIRDSCAVVSTAGVAPPRVTNVARGAVVVPAAGRRGLARCAVGGTGGGAGPRATVVSRSCGA